MGGVDVRCRRRERISGEGRAVIAGLERLRRLTARQAGADGDAFEALDDAEREYARSVA